jgi:cell division protein FtsQ
MSEENKRAEVEKKEIKEGDEKPRYVRQYIMRKRHKRTYEESRPEPVFTQPELIKKHESEEEQIAKELEQKKKKQKAKKLLFACIIAFILILMYPLFRLVSNVFVINEIVVEGKCPYSAEELLAASGLVQGNSLFGNDYDAASKKTLEALPYLRSCKVESNLPDKIVFTVVSGEAVIYTEVAGEYYALSAALRVLERQSEPTEFVSKGLVFATLPPAALSVVGEYIKLSDGTDPAYITKFLDALSASSLKTRVSRMFLDEKFDMIISVDARYRIKLGSPESIERKLLVAERVIEECSFSSEEKGIIDVTNPENPTSLKKNDIDINTRRD